MKQLKNNEKKENEVDKRGERRMIEWQIIFVFGFIFGWIAKGIGELIINKFAKDEKGEAK